MYLSIYFQTMDRPKCSNLFINFFLGPLLRENLDVRRIPISLERELTIALLCGMIKKAFRPCPEKNATFSLRIRLPSTRIPWKRSMKTDFFENALQSGTFWKRCFPVYVWTNENGTFRKSWGQIISSNTLRTILETYWRWRKGPSLSFLL